MRKVVYIFLFCLLLSHISNGQDKTIKGKAEILYHSELLSKPVRIEGRYVCTQTHECDSLNNQLYKYKIFDNKDVLVLEINLRIGETFSYLFVSKKMINGESNISLNHFKPVKISNGSYRIKRYKKETIPPANIIYHVATDKYYILQFSYLTDDTGKNYDEFLLELVTE